MPAAAPRPGALTTVHTEAGLSAVPEVPELERAERREPTDGAGEAARDEPPDERRADRSGRMYMGFFSGKRTMPRE